MQTNSWLDRSLETHLPRQMRMTGQAIDTGIETKEATSSGQGPSHQSPGPSRSTLASDISTAINRNGRYRNNPTQLNTQQLQTTQL